MLLPLKFEAGPPVHCELFLLPRASSFPASPPPRRHEARGERYHPNAGHSHQASSNTHVVVQNTLPISPTPQLDTFHALKACQHCRVMTMIDSDSNHDIHILHTIRHPVRASSEPAGSPDAGLTPQRLWQRVQPWSSARTCNAIIYARWLRSQRHASALLS